MTGFDMVLSVLWNITSSLLIHGLVFGSVVLAVILLARRILRTMPRRAVVWLWLPLLLVMLSPILPDIEIPVPLISQVVSFGEAGADISDTASVYTVPSEVSAELLQGDTQMQITVTEPVVHDEHFPTWQGIIGLVWVVGVIGILGYHLYRHYRVNRICSSTDMVERRGRIRIYTLCGIRTPFVYGFFHPRIFLPTIPAVDGISREMILLHEQMHVRRLDVLWRFLWEAVLCIYWFQPLLWIAQDRFIADTEGACDEAVLISLGADRTCRADYAQTLLLYAGPRKRGYPTAFGMTEMQGRVHAILHPVGIRRTGVIVLGFAVILSSAVACMSPISTDRSDSVSTEIQEEVHKVTLFVEPNSASFGFADGYMEAHPEIWSPTTVSYTLPLGWTVRYEEEGSIRGQIYDDTGEVCGTCFVGAFFPIDGEGIPPENIPPEDRKWHAIYTDLRMSAVQNVADDDYRPIVTREPSESAVAWMDQAIYEEGVPAAVWEHQRVPLVLAYDQDCSLYIQMNFQKEIDTAVMEAIASSITFEKTE